MLILGLTNTGDIHMKDKKIILDTHKLLGFRVELEKTLRVLIEGLDLEPAPQFALGLFKVYHQCELAAKAKAFPEVIQLLSAHRAAWNELRNSE